MIIGVTGRAGAGKDTIGNMLLDLLAEDCYTEYKRVSFADSLKQFLISLSPSHLTRDDFYKGDRSQTVEFPLPTRKAIFELISSHFSWVGNLKDIERASDSLYQKLESYSTIGLVRTTARKLLQQVGTEVFRDNLSYDVWVDAMRHSKSKNLVICDVRFQNEVDFILGNNGVLIAVESGRVSSADTHVSESGNLSGQAHFIIDNSGDLNELQDVVSDIYLELGKAGLL